MRDYDPTLGRYLQADPLGLVDGASIYGCALQNPGRYVDLTGQAIPLYLGRAFLGAVSGGIGAYINSDGCWQAVVMALYLVLRAGFFFQSNLIFQHGYITRRYEWVCLGTINGLIA